ncbi:MAG TPA: sugar phosphate isomerase/epimerase [Clostridiales bacterium]|mgnify:FL=1|jgi:sugar phosphate isomerase/epimerase|nr:sugar phosphate isomerase/epimerase [Clostridiales bacterium]
MATKGFDTVFTGISTACFYPATTEDSLLQIAPLGPACIEVFLNAAMELRPDYLKKLRSIAEGSGIRVVSVHPYCSIMEPMLFFSYYQRRFEEGVELYKHFFAAAALLGADTLVFHGDIKQSTLPREEYFRRFSILWETAKSMGIHLCQENVERCVSGSMDFLADMKRNLPDVEYILDVKQAVRSGQNPFELATLLGEKVRHIHMSDHRKGYDCLVPGSGVFNIREFLFTMRKTGFSGGVIVELYRENFKDIVEISRGFQHLSTIVSTVS